MSLSPGVGWAGIHRVSLVWEPGMNHRQPFSSMASSIAIHTPSTRPRGSVYRKVAS